MPDRYVPLVASAVPNLRKLMAARVWLPASVVFGFGFGITVVLFLTTNRAEEQRVVRGLEFRIEWRTKDFQAKVALAREALLSTAVYMADEPQLDVAEFDRFTSGAVSHSRFIESLSWATPVSHEQRLKFEASGIPIIEIDATGNRIAAAERSDYTPVVAQRRFDNQPPFLGLDLSTGTNRRLAMASARDLGVAKAVMLSVAHSDTSPRYAIFWPIFDDVTVPATTSERRAHIRGYVVGVFLIVDVLNDAIANTPEIPETLRISLSDDVTIEAPEDSFRLVAEYSPSDRIIRAIHAPASIPAAEYSFTRSFNLSGQQWRITGFFSPAAVRAERSNGPLIILFAGPLLTVVLTVLTIIGLGQMSVIRTLVDKRTGELTQTNTKLEALINASPFAIVCLDPEQRVILWNAAAEHIFGYAADDVLGRPYALVVPEEREEFDDRFRRLAGGEVLQNLSSHRRQRDGTIIDTSSSAAAFSDPAGVLLGIIFVIEDTRERNRVHDQLRQAQKMEAVGQLTGGLAHDFNNLLAIIHGNLELLGDEDGLGRPFSADLIDDALRATKRGASLTHRLLAYSGQQQLAPRTVDIGALVTGMFGLLRRVVEETVEIETIIAADLWTPRIDPQQLENALLNLTINARDAMPHGGKLTIAAENVILSDEDSQQYAKLTPGRYIVLSVSDTGTGMAKDVLERALEPFFTTKPIGSGSGLGLSMIYGFVKQSNGHLTMFSEPGLGTSIKLYLPQSKPTSVPEATEEGEPRPAAKDGRVVLVVEDESSVRRLQIRVLNSLGYQTLEAADGPSGLAAFNGAVRVDLLLTDIVLPGGMSGPALAEAARGVQPNLKVLFMSGYAPTIVIQRYDLSGDRVLSKPFTRSALAQAVWELLQERIEK